MRNSTLWIFGILAIIYASTAWAVSPDSSSQKKNENNTNKFLNGFHFVSSIVFGNKAGTYNTQVRGISVIGAGFARTGTKSLEAALHKLGHRIYDTSSMMQHNHADRWLEAAREWKATGESPTAQALVQEIEAEGYTATLDFPMNLFAIIIKEIRPDGKVIFGVRDSVKNWAEAWRDISHIMGFPTCRPWVWFAPSFDAVHYITEVLQPAIKWPVGSVIKRHLPWYEVIVENPGIDGDLDQWIQMHHSFEKQLLEAIPANDFLKYNVKQGWTPLIDFLDLDPTLVDEPFPNINDRETLIKIRQVFDILGMGFPLWVFLFIYGQYRIVKWAIQSLGGPPKKKLA